MKILVTGSRKNKADYRQVVYDNLAQRYDVSSDVLLEGCCEGSADEYAEDFAEEYGYKIKHFPGTPGTFLNRNIEMAIECDEVIAFWDGYSYGTAHTIAQAAMRGKRITVVRI